MLLDEMLVATLLGDWMETPLVCCLLVVPLSDDDYYHYYYCLLDSKFVRLPHCMPPQR